MRRYFCQTRQFYPSVLQLKSQNSFQAKDLKLELVKASPTYVVKDLKFGQVNSPHMLTILWNQSQGWSNPLISKFKPLQIHPFNSTLHYAVQCFEGMKAYRSQSQKLRLFRPLLNMHRLKCSAKFISLPDFDGNQLVKLIGQFVRIQRQFIPKQIGYSLYIRPFMFSMEDTLGVKAPSKAMLMVTGSPVGPYFAQGFKPSSLFIQQNQVRCCQNSTGEYKVGGNYSPTMRLAKKISSLGCEQILWTYKGIVCEVGASNVFLVMKEGSVTKVVTPSLNTMILPGVTRQSVIQLCKEMKIVIEERKVTVDQLVQKANAGILTEMFMTGTAVIINSVKKLLRQDKGELKEINLKVGESGQGEIAGRLYKRLLDIQYGVEEHHFSWKI